MSLVCGFTIPMDCEECYEMTITEPCSDPTINFQVWLTPGLQVYLFVVDKFRNVWRDQITVNNNGSIDLILTNYPDGLFNKYSGIFRIFVASDLLGENIIDLTLFSSLYSCIIFGFSPISQSGGIFPINTQNIMQTNDGYYIYNGTQWILINPLSCPDIIYATAGQTVFTASVNLVDCPLVIVNKIVQPTGWTKTGDKEITFTSGLNLNDEVIIKN